MLPAFFTLASRGLLPAQWRLIGSGRGDVSHEDFAGHTYRSLPEFGALPDAASWGELR